jgi:hypothetical protein
MGESDDPEEPPATEVQRQTPARSSSAIAGVRLPPDLLETWWERVLAIVAIGLVAWTIVDVARYGL